MFDWKVSENEGNSEDHCRAAHRFILEVGSKVLDEDIQKLRTSHEDNHSNILRLNMSTSMMDIILEYLHRREPIEMTEVFAAAKRLGLREVMEQVEELF